MNRQSAVALCRAVRPQQWLSNLVVFAAMVFSYGVFRYQYLSHRRTEGQSPERLMLSDRPLLIAVGLGALTAAGILYVGGGQ